MVHAKRPGNGVILCWGLGIAFFVALAGAMSSPVSGRDKGTKAAATHPWYWIWIPQELAISPDGKSVAACVSGPLGRLTWGAVWMSNVAGGGTRLILPGPLYKGGANCVAFSGDSKLLGLCRAAGVNPFRALEPMGPSFMMADYAVQLVDSPTGDAAGGFMRQGSVDRIAFSPDGRWIAAARAFGAFPPFPPPLGEPGNLLHLWERQSGEAAKLSTSYHFDVGGLAFSPDSTELAVANKKHISLLDVRERQEVHRFDCHSPCYRAAFSPDGKFIAAADSHGLIYAWEVSTGKKLAVKAGRTWCRHSVIFSPAGEELVAASEDNATTIRFWDVSSGEEVKSLSFPEGAPCPFFFTPDGKAIVGGGAEASPVIHVWDVNTGKELQRWDLTPVQERGGR